MSEQLELVPAPAVPRRRSTAPAADVPLAEQDPVATVLVDTPLAHLDRPFEYAVPADLADVPVVHVPVPAAPASAAPGRAARVGSPPVGEASSTKRSTMSATASSL